MYLQTKSYSSPPEYRLILGHYRVRNKSFNKEIYNPAETLKHGYNGNQEHQPNKIFDTITIVSQRTFSKASTCYMNMCNTFVGR